MGGALTRNLMAGSKIATGFVYIKGQYITFWLVFWYVLSIASNYESIMYVFKHHNK